MNRRIFLAGAVLALGGCATTPDPGREAAAPAPRPGSVLADSLVGTRWVGVVAGNPDPRSLPRIEFVREGRLTGFTGCNMMNGVWSLEAGHVRVGPIATTKRACVGPEGDTERRLAEVLGGNVTREGGKLVFTGPGGNRFEFIPARAS